MMHCFKFTAAILLLLLLTGCANTPNNHLAKYEESLSKSLPEISLFYHLPSDKLRRECSDFEQQSALNYCNINHINGYLYIDSLNEAGLFQKVYPGRNQSEYQVEISTAFMMSESAGDITKAALAGATLLMVPVTMRDPIKAEVNVYWYGEKIKTFEYSLPYERTLSLFHDPAAGNKNFADTLTSHFLKDAQESKVFDPTFLLEKLNASNYQSDLKSPEKFSEFVSLGIHNFSNPFQGAGVRYQHTEYPDDYIELIVYPIRELSWEKQQEVIKQELKLIQDGIKVESKEQKWQSLAFTDITEIDIDTQAGYFWEAKGLIKQDDEPLYRSVYLFIQKDKFVKFQASFPASFMQPFVKAVLPQVQVPEESLFMSKLRLKERMKFKSSDKQISE